MSHLAAVSRRTLPFFAVLALLAAESPLANAQAPKVGREYYEDNVDLGFKVKMPKDWEFIPPQPGEKKRIGKFTPEFNKWLDLDRGNDQLWIDAFLVKFDRRENDDERAFDVLDGRRGYLETEPWVVPVLTLADELRAKMVVAGWTVTFRRTSKQIAIIMEADYWAKAAVQPPRRQFRLHPELVDALLMSHVLYVTNPRILPAPAS